MKERQTIVVQTEEAAVKLCCSRGGSSAPSFAHGHQMFSVLCMVKEMIQCVVHVMYVSCCHVRLRRWQM
jgi:hypothetical protein